MTISRNRKDDVQLLDTILSLESLPTLHLLLAMLKVLRELGTLLLLTLVTDDRMKL